MLNLNQNSIAVSKGSDFAQSEQEVRGQGAISSKGKLPPTPLQLHEVEQGSQSPTEEFSDFLSGGVQSQEENPPAPLPLLEDELLFYEEEVEQPCLENSWKILVVDDEDEVHKVTKLALKKFTLENKNLTFISAYSAQEARELIAEHPDTAMIFLDVIMETENAGLEFVKYVREVLNNQLVRIILRTGQPGQVPEKSVILNYEIDDYKTKTELTGQKLFTTVVTALRSFSTLNKMQEVSRKLEQAQLQLVQNEKMSSLGQLVTAVTREIDNPVNFIYGNLNYASKYMQELVNLLHIYQEEYPNPTAKIQAETQEIELDFLTQDFSKILSSMQVGVERIRDVVQSLRTFSHIEEAELKQVNIHSGIDSTLKLLETSLKAKPQRPAIQIIKEYGDLPLIECHAALLNQVFMDILSNMIQRLDEHHRKFHLEGIDIPPSAIAIYTEMIDAEKISIRFVDNGPVIPEEILQGIFAPQLMTEHTGKDAQLGLSLSYTIVTEKHSGSLQCFSAPEQGTEFAIVLPRSYTLNLTNCN
jgi:two-component system NtrC family sensor kinase